MPEPESAAAAPGESFLLQIEGFEGPLDLLLDLARKQKVDLARISILQLVEQYLAIVEGARKVRLELAADWLVMTAWLTWLKSRLLVPADPEEAAEGEQAAEVLAARLRDLEAVRAAALWLSERPILGQSVFPRGVAENFTETDRSKLSLDLPALMRAYLSALRRGGARQTYQPKAFRFWTVNDALSRLRTLIGELPSWTSLERFLPEHLDLPQRRAALASTLIASLEMAKSGMVQLQQDEIFGPILVGPGEPDRDEGGEEQENPS